MVENTEGVGEVERSFVEGQRVDARVVEDDVGNGVKILPRHGECLVTGIETVKLTHALGHAARPSSRATPDIGAAAIGREPLPGEDEKVIVEECRELFIADRGLVEAGPFVAEGADGGLV